MERLAAVARTFLLGNGLSGLRLAVVLVCMFRQLSSPASACAYPVLRNMCVTIHNLTPLVGSSSLKHSAKLLRRVVVPHSTSPMLRKADAA